MPEGQQGAGATGTGDGGQQNQSSGQQGQGASSGQGAGQSSAGGGQSGSGQSQGRQSSGGSTSSRNGGGGSDAWAEIASEFGSPDEVRRALGHARTWEQRAKENYQGAQRAGTLEQQLGDMQEQLKQRDERDRERDAREVQRAGKTALAQLKAALVTQAIDIDDLDEDALPEGQKLLKDGEPDEDKIQRVAKSLAKMAGRPVPDTDQGQKGGDAPPDMNNWLRRPSAGARR